MPLNPDLDFDDNQPFSLHDAMYDVFTGNGNTFGDGFSTQTRFEEWDDPTWYNSLYGRPPNPWDFDAARPPSTLGYNSWGEYSRDLQNLARLGMLSQADFARFQQLVGRLESLSSLSVGDVRLYGAALALSEFMTSRLGRP